MSASDAAPLPRLGEVFFDVRGDSRSMRLSWYADTGVAVFSIWQGGRCTGTFRLPIDDLPRMIEILQRGPERRRRPVPDGGRPERADRGRTRNEPGYYGEGDYSDGDYGDGDYGDGGGGHDDGGGHDEAGYEPSADNQTAYDQGDYDKPGYDRGDKAGYDRGGYDKPGYDRGDKPGYDRGGYDQPAHDQPAHDTGYDDAGYEPGDRSHGGSRQDGYGADEFGPGRYGPDDRAGASRRPGGGHRAAGPADSAGYQDVAGYSGATPGEPSRPVASRSDVPTGSYWRSPDHYQPGEYQTDGYQPAESHTDGYQPGEYQTDGYQTDGYQTDGYQTDGYQTDGYQTDGYQTDGYQTDGYQTAAYQLGPTDHAAGDDSDLAEYGQERIVPPYVQTRGNAYPNDNAVPGRAQRHGGSGPAYPADHGGVSAEPHRYARSPRSQPGYFEGSEDRLAADTPVSARYSAGERSS